MAGINNVDFSLDFDGTGPGTGNIASCLALLYGTKAGTMPMDRDFGLEAGFIGKPLPVAMNGLALEIAQKTEKYEKRVEVAEVTFSYNAALGQLSAVVHLVKREDDGE